MKQNVTRIGKAGTDLVKNSALMTQIDADAELEHKSHDVGGTAYESQYIDNMTVAQLMNIQKTDKKQRRQLENDDEASFPVFWVVTILGLGLVVALLIINYCYY